MNHSYLWTNWTCSTVLIGKPCYLCTNWTCSTVFLVNHCYLWTNWTCSTVFLENPCDLWTNWTCSTVLLENPSDLWTNWTCSTVLLENPCDLWTNWTCSTVLLENPCDLWTNWTCSTVLENPCDWWTNWTCTTVLLENHCHLWTIQLCSTVRNRKRKISSLVSNTNVLYHGYDSYFHWTLSTTRRSLSSYSISHFLQIHCRISSPFMCTSLKDLLTTETIIYSSIEPLLSLIIKFTSLPSTFYDFSTVLSSMSWSSKWFLPCSFAYWTHLSRS